jgi:glycosyltransferase involved in cell wall biosynthesis
VNPDLTTQTGIIGEIQMKISATIITLNEENNIRECLESVKWVDEIIVSDSGSTDKTVHICEGFGARVYIDEWMGFGAQKNLVAGRARNDWVLNIDADERVTPELKDEITALAKDRFDGYYIPRKNYFGEIWIRRCGWWPDHNLRLYKRSAGAFSEKRVHEAVAIDGPKGYFKNPLIHRTYRDVEDYLRRMERYSTLAAEQMLAEGRGPRSLDGLRPYLTFLKMFVLKQGFLDGSTGLMLSRLYMRYTAEKYSKLRKMSKPPEGV